MFDNLPKKYLIYIICCNITNKKCVGHMSNLTSRLAVHASTYKKQSYMCTSQEAFENDSYNGIVLEDNLENKVKAKEREAFHMGVFEHSVVNKNRPILIDIKYYQKAYQKEYKKENTISTIELYFKIFYIKNGDKITGRVQGEG